MFPFRSHRLAATFRANRRILLMHRQSQVVERLSRIRRCFSVDTASQPPTAVPHRTTTWPFIHRAPQMTKLLSAIAYQLWL